MAGIGFQLRKLARQDTISSVVAAAGHGAVIAAGPWLFTILSLGSVSVLASSVVSLETLATFRAIIIYAFAISLVATAPVTIVATRCVADAMWLKRPHIVRRLLLGAYVWALIAVLAGMTIVLLVFRLPPPIAVVLGACSMLVGLIWVTLCFCGAVRDYLAVTLSFAVGLVVSLIASVGAAILGYEAPGMAAGFLLGLTVTCFGMDDLRAADVPRRRTRSGCRREGDRRRPAHLSAAGVRRPVRHGRRVGRQVGVLGLVQRRGRRRRPLPFAALRQRDVHRLAVHHSLPRRLRDQARDRVLRPLSAVLRHHPVTRHAGPDRGQPRAHGGPDARQHDCGDRQPGRAVRGAHAGRARC